MDATDILNISSSRQPRKYAEPVTGHVSLGSSLRFILFLIPSVVLAIILFLILTLPPEVSVPIQIVGMILIIMIVSGVRVAAEWERGVVLRLGKFQGLKGPGMMYILPFIEYVRFIDIRVLAINIPSQKVITRDNVPAQIDGALFFRVEDAEKAVVRIQDFQFAISQFAQASLRDVVGGLTLDELLTEREQIQDQIGKVVEERIQEWGIHLDSVRLLDIEMPEDLKRMMSRQASAEREKRANITKAEGDKLAAANLAEAARIMLQSPGAIQLRTLQTVDGLGPTPSNTVILFPAELGDALRGFVDNIGKK
ncbi:MAG TPA: SPFH domain-containing protein [Ignavibacteriales bacterium]|nr:SPFH domain-containing protein [Ignavibacteriales bacterium]